MHHAQLHHRILVVVDGLVVQPHRHRDARLAHLHHRGDAVPHDEVAARVVGDRCAAPAHQLDVGLRDVDRMAIGDVLRHQADLVQPLQGGLAVPAQPAGLLHRRLQRVHMNPRLPCGDIDDAPRKLFRQAVRPGRRQQDAGVAAVVLGMQIGEQREVIRLELRLVVIHARLRPVFEIRRQSFEEGKFIEREL